MTHCTAPARVHSVLHRQLRLVFFVLLVRTHYFTAEDDKWVTAPTADSPCETAFSLPPKTHQKHFQWAGEGEREQGAPEHDEEEKTQIPPQVLLCSTMTLTISSSPYLSSKYEQYVTESKDPTTPYSVGNIRDFSSDLPMGGREPGYGLHATSGFQHRKHSANCR